MSIIPTNPITSDVSAITGAWDATMAFVGAVLPPTQARLDRLKIKHYQLYQNVRLHIENKLYDKIKEEVTKIPVTVTIITNYVDFMNSDLPIAEQNDLIAVIAYRFGIIPKS